DYYCQVHDSSFNLFF
nr:immunoglobulin light chain junction region [Macaca mulatta]MOX29731.1 immunoglobulin light chain junction region [Macaca mulatta]MOX30599.1 immunoglobulin light chain junction region [Macaca mulatta]MOX31517.1 immunoglobulin light chain junction region [Macaca mulatta]MOX31859.1 immunoglobulin light chain junction region [Macaca mulatta]